MVKLYFDGGCGPKNPGGIAAYGFCVMKDGKIIHKQGGYVGEGKGMTNNVAEYNGLLHGLKYLLENGYNREIVKVYGDSKMVLNIVTKRWGHRANRYDPHHKYPDLRELVFEIHGVLSEFMEVSFEWVGRRKNSVADGLAGQVIKERSQNSDSV